MSLLTKTTLIYLFGTLITFFIVALFLTHEADKFIRNELALRFEKDEGKMVRHIEKGGALDEHAPLRQAYLLEVSPHDVTHATYADTVFIQAGTEHLQHFRKKTMFREIGGRFYRLEILSSIEEFERFRDDIFGSIIPAFVLLALGIVGFNFLLSGYLFRPFNRILSQMKNYQTGQSEGVKIEPTTTREFVKMQELFHRMLARIDRDYRNLKEYTENMAHEIQTPLTVLLNKSENLIADDAVMEKHTHDVKTIYDEVNHLSRLGNALNLLTKIENREFDKAGEILTQPVIKQHVASVHELADLKSMKIDLDVADDHSLTIDPFLLDVIIKNLLRNAIRYGDVDSVITIAATGNVFSISNDGPPLKTAAENLFERFYRDRQADGSLGLGLALVKKICDLNDLKIEYRYNNGRHVFSIINAGIAKSV